MHSQQETNSPETSPTCWHDLIQPTPLTDRVAPAVVDLGLRRTITWNEAEFVLDAVTYYEEREAARWRRTQELIAQYKALHPGESG